MTTSTGNPDRVSAWFVDSSFWYTFMNRRDPGQQAAESALGSRLGRICTTTYVLAETVSLLTKRIEKTTAIELLRVVRDDASCEVTSPDAEQLHKAEELFAAHPDWDFDLVDAISFVIMQDRGIKGALTFDHHFEQMGFTTAPGDSPG